MTLDSLARLPDIAQVWPNVWVQLEPQTPDVHEDTSDAGEYTTHITTGVAKLHEMGYFGGGAKVGVVDTGVWYDHEDVRDPPPNLNVKEAADPFTTARWLLWRRVQGPRRLRLRR